MVVIEVEMSRGLETKSQAQTRELGLVMRCVGYRKMLLTRRYDCDRNLEVVWPCNQMLVARKARLKVWRQSEAAVTRKTGDRV